MNQGWLPILSFHFVGCHHEAQNAKVPIHSKNCTKDATGIDQVLRFLDKTEREDPPPKASYLFLGNSATWTYKNVRKTKKYSTLHQGRRTVIALHPTATWIDTGIATSSEPFHVYYIYIYCIYT